MEVNSFTFNGINSRSMGIYISGYNTFGAPQKSYEKVSVPGRSGDLLLSNNRFENFTLVYPAIIIDNYESNTKNLRNTLLSTNGYCKLKDTYHPGEFRMAAFEGPMDFDTIQLCAGSIDLEFNCKPQRYLESTDGFIRINTPSSGYNNNVTKFTAFPDIYIEITPGEEGYLSFNNSLGNGTLAISGLNTQRKIYIDCEAENVTDGDAHQTGTLSYDVTRGNINCNKFITGKFPFLAPGITTFNISSNISKFIIRPRLWCI